MGAKIPGSAVDEIRTMSSVAVGLQGGLKSRPGVDRYHPRLGLTDLKALLRRFCCTGRFGRLCSLIDNISKALELEGCSIYAWSDERWPARKPQALQHTRSKRMLRLDKCAHVAYQ